MFVGAAAVRVAAARGRPQKPLVLPPSPSAGVDAAQDVAKRLCFTEYSPDGNVIPVEPTAFRLTLAKTS